VNRDSTIAAAECLLKLGVAPARASPVNPFAWSTCQNGTLTSSLLQQQQLHASALLITDHGQRY